MLEINDKNFNQEVMGEEKLVVADFWASWCGPCKMLTPVLEEVSKEMKNVKFVKINVDENPALSQKFRGSSIPTVMVFKDGALKDTMVGFRRKEDIVKMVENNL